MQTDPTQTMTLRSFAFDRLSAIAAVLDESGTIVDTNEAWRLFAHLNDGSLTSTGTGVNYLDVCERSAEEGVDVASSVATGLSQILAGEREHFDLEYPCPSPSQDRWFMLQASSAPVADGGGLVLFHVDITGRKLLEASLGELAEHDELTGLPNRRAAVRFIREQLTDTRYSAVSLRVLFFDLDGFKAVNDTHGHHVGDELLAQVAVRARRTVREGDLLARIGGDEFVLVCPNLQEDEANAIAERLRVVMAEPFQVGAAEVTIGASVGLSSSEPDSTVDALLVAADRGMYADKRRRGVGRASND